MKQCSKCNKEKEFFEFAKKGQGYSIDCKSCHREYAKLHYQRNKAYYIQKSKNAMHRKIEYITKLREQPCLDCNKSFPYYVMQFDHIGEKSYNVTQLVTNSWNKLLKEIEKCEIVCANCHAIRTWKRRQTHGQVA